MMSFSKLMDMSIGLMLLGLASSSVEAATTVVSAGAGTLQAAIDAATDGDTLSLTDGEFAGPVNIEKALTITAASGASPVVVANAALGNARLVNIAAAVNWTGVDIVFDTAAGTYGLMIAGGATVTMNDFSITDTANHTGGLYTIYCFQGSTLNLNNLNFESKATRVLISEAAADTVNISQSTFVILGTPGFGFMSWTPGGDIHVDRTIIDTRQTSSSFPVFYGEASAQTVSVTNTVIFFKSFSRIISQQTGGDFSFQHCTFNEAPFATTFGGFVHNAQGAGGSLTLRNNIYALDGTTLLQSYVYKAGNAGMTYNIGMNFTTGNASIDSGGANGDPVLNDGEVVSGHPVEFEGDGYHLMQASPARHLNARLDNAADIGIYIDIDGGHRPNYGGFDFGADQYLVVPAELSDFEIQ